VGSGFERGSEGCNLIDDAPRRPNITFLIVLLVINLLRTHVVGGAHVGLGEDRVLIHHPGEPEVAQLHIVVAVQKHIPWLQVSMQDLLLPIVASLQSHHHLAHNAPDEVLGEGLPFPLGVLDQGRDVSPLTVLHHNVDLLTVLINHPVIVLHNVGVLELAEDVDFGDKHLLFLL